MEAELLSKPLFMLQEARAASLCHKLCIFGVMKVPIIITISVQHSEPFTTIKMHFSRSPIELMKSPSDRFELQPELNDQMKRQLEQRQQVRDSIDEEHQIAGYVRELLLDDKPQIYNDE